jgi:hypothetical protein
MDKSLQLRKQKVIARRRDKKLLASGKLRVEHVSLAAALKIKLLEEREFVFAHF